MYIPEFLHSLRFNKMDVSKICNLVSSRAFLFLAIFSISFSSHAVPIQWEFQSTIFEDSGTVTGYFVYDSEIARLYAWDIDITGGDTTRFPEFTYSSLTGTSRVISQLSGRPERSLGFLESGIIPPFDPNGQARERALRIRPLLALDGSVDIVPLLTNSPNGPLQSNAEECWYCFEFRRIYSGSLSFVSYRDADDFKEVTEPVSAFLALLGVLGLGAIRKRS